MTDEYWHKLSDKEIHEELFEHVKTIQDEQSHIARKLRDLAKFYSNRGEIGLGSHAEYVRDVYAGITDNIIKSVVDTATSLISKTTPKTRVMTDGADWSQQRTARSLERYTKGMFQSLNVYDKMSMAFRDACIFGTGYIYVYTYNGNVFIERVLPTEITVDENTCKSGNDPIEKYRSRFVHKDVLCHKFPEHEEMIRASGQGIYDEWGTVSDKDMVLVVEAWRRNVAGDGKYAMVVENATLECRPYKEDIFPFMVYKWSKPLTGYYGQSLAEQLISHQIRLDDLHDFIKKAQDLIAVPRIFIPAGTKLNKMHIDNKIGRFIPINGDKPPVFHTPEALNAEIYNERTRTWESAFRLAGISEMTSQSVKPAGIEAAVALRELSDNQSQRFSIQQRRYEEAHVDLAKLIISKVKKLAKPPKAYMSGSIMRSIEWPDVDFENNNFVFDIQPSSILGDTPSGRYQRIIEIGQYGIPIKPEVMQRMLAHPDIQLEDERSTSALEHAEWIVDQLYDENYVPPDSFMDLTLSLDRVISALLKAIRDEAPDGVIDGMIEWIIEAQDLISASTAAIPTPMPEGQPMAGNIEDTALPGVVDPSSTATANMMPGLIDNAQLTTG